MRSPASFAVSWGRAMPSCFIRSDIRGRWFHKAVATSKKECGLVLFARSGPTLPPTPLIAWHFSRPLVANTRDPAAGSWLALNTGCALALARATSESATAMAPTTTRIIGDPFCRDLGDRREHFCPTVADPTRITAESQHLLELQPEDARRVRVPYLGVVEDRHAEGV